jgi:hypothetical protein
MKFSVIICKISSLSVYLWASLGYLVLFIFVLLGSGTGYLFSSFPFASCIKIIFFEESGFHHFFFFPLFHLVLCKYVLDRLVGGFSDLFSFPLFNFYVMAVFVISKVAVLFLSLAL